MENTSSFIPQNKGKSSRVRRHRKVYVLQYVTYTVFFGVALVVAGLFLWSLYMDNLRDTARATLEAEGKRFSTADIESVKEFDQRLQHISSLLETTPFVSQLLSAVEESTPANVQIASLELTQEGADAEEGFQQQQVSYQNFNSYDLSLTTNLGEFDTALFYQNALKKSGVIKVTNPATVSVGEDEASAQTGAYRPVTFNIVAAVPFSGINVYQPPITIETDTFSDLDDTASDTETSAGAAGTDGFDTSSEDVFIDTEPVTEINTQ